MKSLSKTMLILVLAFGYSCSVYAQPMTEPVQTIGKGNVQVDVGVGSEVGGNSSEYQYPNYLLIYGIGEHVELRLEGDFNSSHFGAFNNELGISPVQLGMKFELPNVPGTRSETSMMYHIYNTRFSNSGGTDIVGGLARLLMYHPITDRFSLSNCFGFEVGDHIDADLFASVVLAFQYSERISFYSEVHGHEFFRGGALRNIDVGAAYSVLDNIGIDATWGRNIYGLYSSNVLSFVISYSI